MPIVHLTDIVARTAKVPTGKQITYWDRAFSNFGLRVGCRSKSWVVMLGASERRRVTIGHYPTVSVQDARTEARRLIAAAAVVRHDADVAITPFSEALDEFVSKHLTEKKDSTATEWERVLRKHFEPVWKRRLMHEISRGDVATIINKLVRAGGEANNAFAVVRVFMRWSVRRGYLAHSPMEALALPVPCEARDRVLSCAELKAVVGAADTHSTYGTIVMLLLLTAQRRGEMAGLRSEWIDRDNKILTLPKSITKNRLEHAVPLSPLALSLLPERKGLLFPARGASGRSFSGWSKSMRAFRKHCGVHDFWLHDLRRTAATLMAGKGVAPYVIERILNHITGSTAESITPLARVYNRHRYLDEMRVALLLLERDVLGLVHECRGSIPLFDAGFQPSFDFGFDPTDPAGA